MRVQCIANKGKDLPKKYWDAEAEEEYTEYYELKIGHVYIVYGMYLYKDIINYLVAYSINPALPFWYPADLFKVVNQILPMEWYFSHSKGTEDEITAVWGYQELMDDKHFDDLMEREPEALKIFKKRKKEIDEFM
ncbi:hypothetical protein [Marininema halotolerans]|uniref:Phosphoribosylaminoimidazole synthetase n=1 Tax=Marininema halotolerans TaxID=1155944 RepID=A0A1I6ULW0_9BACL|nr:hypothetical protein [Marininema halotolerans]SFT02445.1 hypothetical protein SAMN05444972_11816 [Marininema halotolerans]